MTYESDNREKLETSKLESLIGELRTARATGAMHPCRLTDVVDELMCRAAKQHELLDRVHDFLGEVIRDSLMDDTPRASDLADDIWDLVNIGTERWFRLRAYQRAYADGDKEKLSER